MKRRIIWRPKCKWSRSWTAPAALIRWWGKGGNDGQAQRLWTALRASINDLARCYNLTPMA